MRVNHKVDFYLTLRGLTLLLFLAALDFIVALEFGVLGRVALYEELLDERVQFDLGLVLFRDLFLVILVLVKSVKELKVLVDLFVVDLVVIFVMVVQIEDLRFPRRLVVGGFVVVLSFLVRCLRGSPVKNSLHLLVL